MTLIHYDQTFSGEDAENDCKIYYYDEYGYYRTFRPYYEYNSSVWVNSLDITIMSFIGVSIVPILVAFFSFICEDCGNYICSKRALFWLFESIFSFLKDWLCLCFGCCEGFGICCKKCCGNDLPELKEENLKLKLKISNLTNEIEEIKRQKNIDDNILNSERNKFNN